MMGGTQENQESPENVRDPVDELVEVQNVFADLHLEDTEDTSEGERILELLVAASLLFKYELLDVVELRQIFLQIPV